ncbi:hypothetical protein D9619_004165 [Psilocybe cf. subviscida]|uniref:Arrestin-like N-terminal domain-containing protein n=1 Tax=Psilocybe cf. subviscida TaxID=2480587 RepID=A0A8H5BPM3_9AGAR|nr:hypothetical protein D9619_004165 [Psilocybe cf. subviscida]
MMATAIALPPSYEVSTGDSPNEPLIEDSLPDYAPRVARIPRPVEEREFEYKVEKKKGESLASLKVVAPAAYSKNIPTFCGTGPVKGSVNLYLTEPDTITSVVVSVRGRFLPGRSDSGQSEEELRLFDISNTIWSKDADGAATSPLLSNKKKLSGTHTWPFSVNIPEKVQFITKSSSRGPPGNIEHNLPQTFNDRVVRASIRYEVVLRIGRGKLKTNYKITCTFGYNPVIRPPPFPALKTIAYQGRTPLLEPTVDVDGWIPAKTVNVPGTLFNSRPVAIECQSPLKLFLSAPLVYTRGSVIPLYVRMQSSDQQALDLLATHKAIVVHLQRKIQHHLPMANLKNPEHYHTSMGRDVRDLVEAVWWPARSQEQEGSTTDSRVHTVCLNGELHLKADLVPSTTFPVFRVNYNVILRPFDTPGFKAAKPDNILLEHPVDIVTSFAPGPRAVRSAPPGYDSGRSLTAEYGVAIQGLDSFF